MVKQENNTETDSGDAVISDIEAAIATKCQGWLLLAEGDNLAASRIFVNFSFSTGLALYRLMLRRVFTASKTFKASHQVKIELSEIY